jgi:hypothetical protein
VAAAVGSLFHSYILKVVAALIVAAVVLELEHEISKR